MLKNMWYLVLTSEELTAKKPLKETRLSNELVFWRDSNNQVICMDDLCPHRGVALSIGKIKDNCIICPFHGFEFDKEGSCKFIPSNGSEHSISKNYSVKTYPIREEHGFIWLWYGEERSEYPNIDFFEFLDSSFSYNARKEFWKTHYTRAIENQLDVSHLAFVHKKTIGRGDFSQVNGPLVEVENNRLKIWVDNKKQGEKRITLDKDLEFLKTRAPSLEFRFPNIWTLRISDKFFGFLGFVPVNEEETVIYMRFYQKIVTFPIAKDLFNFINGISNKIIINEDYRVVVTQKPLNSLEATEEKLVRADLPIVIFRKMMKNLENM